MLIKKKKSSETENRYDFPKLRKEAGGIYWSINNEAANQCHYLSEESFFLKEPLI